jgi:flagellar motor switch protein FliG
MKRQADLDLLTGPQKAAILMLALGEDQCAKLFALMPEDDIRDISAAMAQLGTVRAETVELVCQRFADRLGKPGTLIGDFDTT